MGSVWNLTPSTFNSFIPSYLFPSINALSFVYWIWRKSITAQRIGSGVYGLGVGSIGFDWSTVARDAKNDPVRQQAYRLLMSIHHSFEQISDVILASDRARREAVDLEAKLSAMASPSFDIEKLHSDLEAIRKENAFLEQLSKINL